MKSKVCLVFFVQVFIMACYDRPEEAIDESSFQVFMEAFEDENYLYLSGDTSMENEITDAKGMLKDFFGELNESKIGQLYEAELASFSNMDSITLGTSIPALSIDTINGRGRRCGTFDDSDSTAFKAFSNKSRLVMPAILPRRYIVPVEFHVVSSGKPDSWVPSRIDLDDQLKLLNAEFDTINIRFYISDVSYDVNKEWSLGYRTQYGNKLVDDFYDEMIESIDWENSNALHIYINETAEILGQASFPYRSNTNYRTKYDNVLISRHTLNGRVDQLSGYKMEGKTLVHEVGHFLGLYHTFHSTQKKDCDDPDYNGCSFPGDYVEDTPPQKFCHFHGCGTCLDNLGHKCDNNEDCKDCDTCLFDNKKDDVTNFMGYNPDSCINKFSPGQYIRMQKYFLTNRSYLIQKYEPLYSL